MNQEIPLISPAMVQRCLEELAAPLIWYAENREKLFEIPEGNGTQKWDVIRGKLVE